MEQFCIENLANYKGCYNLLQLPSFMKDTSTTLSDLYLIKVDNEIYFAVIVINVNNAIIFNPTTTRIRIPFDLRSELTKSFDVCCIHGYFISQLKYILGCCIYFLYHLSNINLDEDISFATIRMNTFFPPHYITDDYEAAVKSFMSIHVPSLCCNL